MTRQEEDRRKSRKGWIGLGAIAVAGALVVGLGYAYFSDTIAGEGRATAGTLDITGELTVYQNGVADADGTIENFNPGDVLTISGDIANEGNKEAWIRTLVSGTADEGIAPYLYVYAGETVPTQTTLLGTETDALTGVDGYIGDADDLADGIADPALVIAGTGNAAETTEATTTETGEYSSNVVIYFDKEATNEAQDQDLSVTVDVQAIQYKNNTTLGNVNWDSVVDTAFSLPADDGDTA